MPAIPKDSRLIIPSVHRLATLDRALEGPPSAVLLADVHVGNIGPLARRCREAGHKVLVRPDLVQGLRSDQRGITLLKQEFSVDGTFTGSASTARLAQKVGLEVYWRFFLVDSRALDTAASQMNTMPWDGFEIAPGPLALQFARPLLASAGSKPLIAGGFISDDATAGALFDAGYSAVNTSCTDIWPKRQ